MVLGCCFRSGVNPSNERARQLRLPGRPQLDRGVPLVAGSGPQDHVRVEQRGARRGLRSDVRTEVDETLPPFLRRQPERAQRGPDVLFSRVTVTSIESNRLTISTAQPCVTSRARISTSENSLADSPGAEVGLDCSSRPLK